MIPISRQSGLIDRIASEILAERNNDTFKCPECGTKVLDNTGYCVKCQKKVEKE